MLREIQCVSLLHSNSDAKDSVVGGSEERIEELQEFVNLTVEDAGNRTSRPSAQVDNLNDLLFAKDFCFVQRANGIITNVIYPHGENIQVANIKKSIASAFQANFKQDSAREETDVSGAHRASYRFVLHIHAMSLHPWIDTCISSIYMITEFWNCITLPDGMS